MAGLGSSLGRATLRGSAGLALATLITLGQAPASPAATLSLKPIGNFESPTYITSEPDPEMLLVTEREGTIELVDHGQVSTFADLSSLVDCEGSCVGERGLMSLAVAPDFATSGQVYVDFTNNSTGEIHVDELTAEGNTAPLSSLRPLLTIEHSDADNHNGGQLQFGPDGYLYVSTGDGGGGNDQFHNSQNLGSLLGKLLRINPSEASPTPTIWSYGLRNPFRFSFDRRTGDMVIGDVGQSAREEVDFAPRLANGEVGGQGVNYGWNCREGFIEGPADDLPGEGCATGSFTNPVFDYPHNDPGGDAAHGCAIIGGYVVRDRSLGDLYGRYVYGDLCVGEIRSLLLPATGNGRAGGDRSEGLEVANLNSFGEDSCGRIYTVSGSGEISRLEGPTPAVCGASEEPPPRGEPPPYERTSQTEAPTKTEIILSSARKVKPGARALLRATVTPCPSREGQTIQLDRGGRKLASAQLNEDCTAEFRVSVAHRSTFRALVGAIGEYLSARTAKLTIKIAG